MTMSWHGWRFLCKGYNISCKSADAAEDHDICRSDICTKSIRFAMYTPFFFLNLE